MTQNMGQLLVMIFLCDYAAANAIRNLDSLQEFSPWNISSESEWLVNNSSQPSSLDLSNELKLSSTNRNLNKNNSRTGRTRWYNRIWHDNMIAPNIEAGSSSSESIDSWSMECDCKQTTKKATTATTKTLATTTKRDGANKNTEKTSSTSPRTSSKTTTLSTTSAPPAFDDENYDANVAEDISISVGDSRWRRRYRAWLRKCGCDLTYYD